MKTNKTKANACERRKVKRLGVAKIKSKDCIMRRYNKKGYLKKGNYISKIWKPIIFMWN